MTEDFDTAKQRIYQSEDVGFHYMMKKINETLKSEPDVTHLSFYTVSKLDHECEMEIEEDEDDIDAMPDLEFLMDEHYSKHGRAYHFFIGHYNKETDNASIRLRSEEIYQRDTLMYSRSYEEGLDIVEKFYDGNLVRLERKTDRSSCADGSISQHTEDKHFDGKQVHPFKVRTDYLNGRENEKTYQYDTLSHEFKNSVFHSDTPKKQRDEGILKSETTHHGKQSSSTKVTFENNDIFYKEKSNKHYLEVTIGHDGIIDRQSAWVKHNGGDDVDTAATLEFLSNLKSIERGDRQRFWWDKKFGGQGDDLTPIERAERQVQKAYADLKIK